VRHARPRERSRHLGLWANACLATAAVAGFTWGTMTISGDGPTAVVRNAVAAQEPSLAAPIPEPPASADAAQANAAQADTAEADTAPAEAASLPETDPTWPADQTGKGCDAPVWPAAAAGTPRVLVIGDSLTRDSRTVLESDLQASGWAPTVRCWGMTGTAWGVTQVERARELGQLPDTVVIALGTNDIWWIGVPIDEGVDRMMAALGSDRDVLWVNFSFGVYGVDNIPDADKANTLLAAKAAEYPNLRIVDFDGAMAAAAGQGASWTDGIHLNHIGGAARASAIVAALGAA
jgi:hypothetical protein